MGEPEHKPTQEGRADLNLRTYLNLILDLDFCYISARNPLDFDFGFISSATLFQLL